MEGHRYISNETNFYMRQPFQGFPWIKTPRKRCIISTAQSQMFSKLKSVTLRRYKYLVLGRDSSYFAKRTKEKKHSDSPKRYHQHALAFDWQHICYIWWMCFSTDSPHTYGYKLCSSSRRLVPLFVWDRLHTGASQEKRKEANPIL